MKNKKQNTMKLLIILAFILTGLIPASRVDAASAVSVGKIDYDRMTMQIYYNSNSVVFYSTDNSTWSEAEGEYDSSAKSCVMDISWVSKTSDVTLYLKGDNIKTVKSVILPAQNTSFNVKYDNILDEFNFDNSDEADSLEWRKATDYNWMTVDMDQSSASYQRFIKKMNELRVKGSVIIIRIPQVTGTGISNAGMRPSIERTVTISARAAAPVIRVNSSRLTLGTASSMEYYDPASDLWMECSPTMSLNEIAPEVLYENGSSSVTLRIRKAATASAPYSKTAHFRIPGQSAAPTIGDNSSEVTYYYMNSKLILQFNRASDAKVYQYAIVREDADYDAAIVSWRDIKSTDLLTLSSGYAPQGATVYIRRKGTDADSDDISDLVLASAANSFTVKY
jgi:hypothetical protein